MSFDARERAFLEQGDPDWVEDMRREYEGRIAALTAESIALEQEATQYSEERDELQYQLDQMYRNTVFRIGPFRLICHRT
jgi:hypothetical protein